MKYENWWNQDQDNLKKESDKVFDMSRKSDNE